jgi:hypothetical protein
MRGEPMTVFGYGVQKRGVAFTADLAPAIAASAEMPKARNETYAPMCRTR